VIWLPLLQRAAPYLAAGLLVVTFGGWCWTRGASHAEAKAEALRARQEAVALKHAQELAKRADEITLVYLTQTRTVRERGQTIVREVPRYVTPADDAACPTDGLVRVLNAAARNVPLTTGSPDATPAGTPANP